MQLRMKKGKQLCSSSDFNIHSLSEILVRFPEGDMDSDFINNYEVWLEQKKEWKCLSKAFKDKDVIINNYNTSFFEPPTEEDRERGFTLS